MEFVAKFIIFVAGILIGCEAGGSSTLTLGRSQSMAASSRLSSFKPNLEARVRVEPDISSSVRELDSQPSTSQRDVSLHETESLIGSRRASLTSTIDLTPASIPTTHGMNLNPQRDGVFARVRHIIFGTLAPAAAGVGIGVGVAVLANSTFSLESPTSTTSINPEIDNINIIG